MYWRIYKLLRRLRTDLRSANSLSEGESQHIERSLNKTLGELLQVLVPLNQVKLETHVHTRKLREIIS